MTRLTGCCLITNDVPALAEFYGACFGVPIEAWNEFAWVHLPGAVLSVFSAAGMARMAPDWAASGRFGAMMLEVEVDDVELALDRAVAAGAEVVKPVTTQPWGRTSVWFRDPDGNLVNIYRPTERVDPVEVVRDYFRRLFDERDLAACDQLSPGYVDHDAPAGTAPGATATRQYVAAMLEEDPQLRVDVLTAVGQDSTVAAQIRWIPGPDTGREPTDGLILINLDERGRLRERNSVYPDGDSPVSSRSTTGAS